MAKYTSAGRQKLAETAKETIAILPTILPSLKGIDATQSELLSLAQLKPLTATNRSRDATSNPGMTLTESNRNAAESTDSFGQAEPNLPRRSVRVRVLNSDTIDTAIAVSNSTSDTPGHHNQARSSGRVAILNLASERNPGGGWRTGALAQEECICYRSSLYLSLHRSYYPIPPRSGLYSPDVVIVRNSYGEGHQLLVPEKKPEELPVLSVISVAGIRRPQTRTVDASSGRHEVYANEADLELTKDKMRLTLRIAAHKGHARIVLGALGCGAFRNPPGEVAKAWAEVLKEPEFSGRLWDDIVFAVLDKGSDPSRARDRDGNFEVFRKHLDGLMM